MADLNPTSLITAALGGLIGEGKGSDSKTRSDSDTGDDFFKNSSNFTAMMAAQVGARQPDDHTDTSRDAPRDTLEHVSVHMDRSMDRPGRTRPADRSNHYNERMTNDTKTTVAASNATAIASSKLSVKDSNAKADLAATADAAAKVAAADNDAFADPRAADGLKLVAKTLLQAEKDGKLKLPDAFKGFLEKIAATDGSPGQILPLMKIMLNGLQKLEDSTTDVSLQAPAGDMVWPKAIADLFQSLQVNPGVKTDKPIDLGKMIKALRMLGHLVQHAGEALKKSAGGPAAVLARAVLSETKKTNDADITTSDPVETPAAETKNAEDDEAKPIVINDAALLPMQNFRPIITGNTNVVASDKSTDDNNVDLDGALIRSVRPGHVDTSASGNGGNKRAVDIAANATPPLAFVGNDESASPALNPLASAMSARSIFTAAAATPAGQTTSNIPHPSTQQIVVALQKSPITKDTQLSLQLNPAELGRVDVKITIDQNGKASAQIMAERADTLAMLQKDTSHLEKALQAAGLNSSAQDLHYSLKEQNGQRSGQEFSQKRRRSLFETDDDAKTISVDATLSGDGLSHRVNYHA